MNAIKLNVNSLIDDYVYYAEGIDRDDYWANLEMQWDRLVDL